LAGTPLGFLIFVGSGSNKPLGAGGMDEKSGLTYRALVSMAMTRSATMLWISFTLCADMGFEYSVPINGRNRMRPFSVSITIASALI
jgi:hypothetical protein